MDYDANSNTAILNDVNENNIDQVYQKYIQNRKNALSNDKRTSKEVYTPYGTMNDGYIQFYLRDNGDLTMDGYHTIYDYGYKIASNIVKIGLAQPDNTCDFPGMLWYIDSNGQFSYIFMDDLINSDKGKFTIKTSEELKYIIDIEHIITGLDGSAFIAIDIQGNEILLY